MLPSTFPLVVEIRPPQKKAGFDDVQESFSRSEGFQKVTDCLKDADLKCAVEDASPQFYPLRPL
jgi:hypothetical protein